MKKLNIVLISILVSMPLFALTAKEANEQARQAVVDNEQVSSLNKLASEHILAAVRAGSFETSLKVTNYPDAAIEIVREGLDAQGYFVSIDDKEYAADGEEKTMNISWDTPGTIQMEVTK